MWCRFLTYKGHLKSARDVQNLFQRLKFLIDLTLKTIQRGAE
jgi:hypothetical protein